MALYQTLERQLKKRWHGMIYSSTRIILNGKVQPQHCVLLLGAIIGGVKRYVNWVVPEGRDRIVIDLGYQAYSGSWQLGTHC